MRKVSDRVCIARDNRICRDLWSKMGTIEEIKGIAVDPQVQAWWGKLRHIEPRILYVVKLDNPKREGMEDMPYLQCEAWAIEK